jgi:hypothetical protein
MAKRYQGDKQNLYVIEEQTTQSDYTLVIFWSLCCLFFYDIQILITPWYLLSIVFRRTDNTMAKGYQEGNQSLYIIEEQTTKWPKDTNGVIRICKSKTKRQHNGTPLVYFGHCVVCSSMVYRFWLHPWYLLAIVLSVLLWYTDSDYTLVIFTKGVIRICKS